MQEKHDMTPEDLLQQALSIAPPWRVVEVRDHLERNQIDVWIGRSGWFFGSGAEAPETHPLAWRHINVGQARCLAHAPPEVADDDLPWSGSAEQPLTRAAAAGRGHLVRLQLHPQLPSPGTRRKAQWRRPRPGRLRRDRLPVAQSDARLHERRRVGPR
ncbi:MAG: hypothetical protein RBT86_03655 [Azospira sp.]|jgi:hypothetical protein|nr:hypothetical protein [Azospira sp.]